MAETPPRQSIVTVSNYRVLFDRQRQKGYRASYGSAAYRDGRLTLLFIRASDAVKGESMRLTTSDDLGRTWSAPVGFGPPLPPGFPDAHQTVNLTGVTPRGTLLGCGHYLPRGIREDGNHEHYIEDVAWRPCDALIGRQESSRSEMTWTRFPTGTFMGEQFLEPGIVTRTGRVVLALWGAQSKGDNWGCGVILSDDDGVTWRFRHIGCVRDHLIRNNPAVPAGFNEQTLFEAPDGTLVSLIRGREKLGAADAEGRETYYFRSVSRDGGETWSTPALTNLPGTGASHGGIALPDGSLLFCVRIPHHPETTAWIRPEDPALNGLHIVRSTDHGDTWQTVRFLQQTPEGEGFDNYYNAMNGCFVPLSPNRWMYAFGHFDHKRDRHRMLCFDLAAG
ncbi:MAG: glycoside hydrolase [Planctomycetes bacterium]|nr:glycoside hydrolase [Planctomycetota bacterium]